MQQRDSTVTQNNSIVYFYLTLAGACVWSYVVTVTASVIAVTLRQDHARFAKPHCYSGKRFDYPHERRAYTCYYSYMVPVWWYM